MKYISDKDIPRYREANQPKECPIFRAPMRKPVLDHAHPKHGGDGRVRGVIEDAANVMLGAIENAYSKLPTQFRPEGLNAVDLSNILHRMSIYVKHSMDTKGGVLHPEGARQLVRRFSRQSKDTQIEIMRPHFPHEDILKFKNSSERTNAYRKLLQSNKYYATN